MWKVQFIQRWHNKATANHLVCFLHLNKIMFFIIIKFYCQIKGTPNSDIKSENRKEEKYRR